MIKGLYSDSNYKLYNDESSNEKGKGLSISNQKRKFILLDY